jgi:hypothetical protein
MRCLTMVSNHKERDDMANDRRIAWRVTDLAINDVNNSNAVELDVHHSKGGANYFSGGIEKAGYSLSVNPVKVENGSVSFVIGNNLGRRFFIESAARFNAKRLDQLAAAIKPHTAAIVANLIAGNYDAIRSIVTEATTPTVTVTRTKKALGTLLREALEAKNLPVLIHSEDDGRMTYEIAGTRYTPGEAAAQLGVVWQ